MLYNLLLPARSRGSSSGSSSGHNTPKMNVTSLPPGFIGNNNDGHDVTIEGTTISALRNTNMSVKLDIKPA